MSLFLQLVVSLRGRRELDRPVPHQSREGVRDVHDGKVYNLSISDEKGSLRAVRDPLHDVVKEGVLGGHQPAATARHSNQTGELLCTLGHHSSG